MRKTIKQTGWLVAAVLLALLPMAGLTGCGGDEPSDGNDTENGFDNSDFVGFWIDDAEETVFQLGSTGRLTAYELQTAGSMFYVNEYSGTWNYQKHDNTLHFNWDGSYPPSDVTSDGAYYTVTDCTARELVLKNPTGKTIIMESHGGNLKPAEDEPDTPTSKFKKEDFYGIWLHQAKGAVFNFKNNGIVDCYWLTESEGNEYDAMGSGEWSFNADESELSVYVKRPGAMTETLTRWTIKEVGTDYFRTTDVGGLWERRSSLPSPADDSKCSDDERIYGKWKGTDDGVTYTLTFSENGVMKETWKDGTDSETGDFEYSFRKKKLNFPGDEPSFANVLGEPPFDVEFSSTSKYMTVSKGSYSIKFTRQ